MRYEWQLGIYQEHFRRCLKWYNLAFKAKHPKKEDEEVFNLLNIILNDMDKQDEEASEDE